MRTLEKGEGRGGEGRGGGGGTGDAAQALKGDR